MSRELKRWNGRIYDYEGGYIAAYSVADAVRVAEEHFPKGGVTPHEINVYWSATWGTPMVGITPERGLWVEKKKTREIVRIVHGKEVPVERGPEYKAQQIQKKADAQAAEAQAQRAREEKRGRMKQFAEHYILPTPKDDAIIVDYRGHKYRIEEVED